MDIKKAYDTVWREGLWWKLEHQFGVDTELIAILRELYSLCPSVVRVEGQFSQSVCTHVGLKQGCILSPLLFNAYVNDLAPAVEAAGGVQVAKDLKVSGMMYADDLGMTAPSRQEAQAQCNALKAWEDKWRLQVSIPKTKAMQVNSDSLSKHPLTYNNETIDVVEDFKYLGVTLNRNGSWEPHVRAAVHKAQGMTSAMMALLTNKNLPICMRMQYWLACVRPSLEYGAAVVTPPDPQKLEAVQHRAATAVLGTIRSAPRVGAQGDLGLPSLRQRFDEYRTKLWGKLEKLSAEDPSRLVARVWKEGGYKVGNSMRSLRAQVNRLKEVSGDTPDLGRIVDHHLHLWWEEVQSLRSLELYQAMLPPGGSKPVQEYPKHPFAKGAQVRAKARLNVLPVARLTAKMQGGSDSCLAFTMGCRETVEHFLCDCPAVRAERAALSRAGVCTSGRGEG